MKKLLITYSLLLIPYYYSSAQNKYVDSLKASIRESKQDTNTINSLFILGASFLGSKNEDSAIIYLNKAYDIAKKLKNERFQAYSLYHLMIAYDRGGNYLKEMELALVKLKLWEKIGDSIEIALTWQSIGNAYDDLDDIETSISYLKDANAVFIKKNAHIDIIYATKDIGYEFTILNMYDSSLKYFQEANNLITNKEKEINPHNYALILYGLGKSNFGKGNLSIALSYYQRSLALTNNSNFPSYGSWVRGITYIGLGALYKAEGKNDSAIFYYNCALKIMYEKKLVPAIYDNLAELNKMSNKDLALMYYRNEISLKDSLNKANSSLQVKNMILDEQEREKAQIEKQKQYQEQRKQNIQFALIALGIITFIIVFLILIRSVIIHERLIELLGVIALLIVFEFLNLLLHPFLGRITNDSPLLMLLALVLLAALLVPLHHRLEKWATHRLIEKNKQIRLAAAKKMIEKLENNKPQS